MMVPPVLFREAPRAVPYMRRNSIAEFRRRRGEVLRAVWVWVLLPVYAAEAIWLTVSGRGSDE